MKFDFYFNLNYYVLLLLKKENSRKINDLAGLLHASASSNETTIRVSPPPQVFFKIILNLRNLKLFFKIYIKRRNKMKLLLAKFLQILFLLYYNLISINYLIVLYQQQ